MRDLSDLVCLWLSSVTFAGSGHFWDFPSSSEGVRGRGESPERLLLPALGQLAADPQPIQIRLHALPPPCLPLLIPPGIATVGFYTWTSYFSTWDPGDYTVNSKGRVMLAWTTLLSLVLLEVLLNPLLQHLAQVKRERKPLSPFLLQESIFHIPSWRKDLYGIKMPTWFFPGSQASSPVPCLFTARAWDAMDLFFSCCLVITWLGIVAVTQAFRFPALNSATGSGEHKVESRWRHIMLPASRRLDVASPLMPVPSF